MMMMMMIIIIIITNFIKNNKTRILIKTFQKTYLQIFTDSTVVD